MGKINKLIKMLAMLSVAFAQGSLAATTYIHTNPQGSVIAKSDADGNIIAHYHYQPFGQRMEYGDFEGTGFTGHQQDGELDLTYMQARYYDPVIGRFYSNDPVDILGHMDLGNPVQGFNRYAYANNNPYKYTDPDGKFLQFIPAIVAVAKVTHKAYKAYKASKSAGRGKQIGNMIKRNGSTKASDIKAKAEKLGFKPSQSKNGPLKMKDENGVDRVTIKGGSDRAPGSKNPHVELKDSNGQRVSPEGKPVARKSPENHTPIKNDLDKT